tara:strand:+ start:305 stop:424 length:120 start_codon:yes stop_codon:yes gene_type:complete
MTAVITYKSKLEINGGIENCPKKEEPQELPKHYKYFNLK